MPKHCIYCGEPVELLAKEATLALNRKMLPLVVAIVSLLVAIMAFGLFLEATGFTVRSLGLMMTLVACAVLLWDIYQVFSSKEKTSFNYGVCTNHQNPIINQVVTWSKRLSYVALFLLVLLWCVNLISLFTLTVLLIILLLAMLSVYRSRQFILFDSRTQQNEVICWIKILGVSELFFTYLTAFKESK